MAGDRRPGRDGVDGANAGAARRSARAVGRGSQRRRAGDELRALERSVGDARQRAGRDDFGLRPQSRLSRRGQGPPQVVGRLAGQTDRRQGQSLLRHGAGDGKAAGGARRPGLARQAHQSRLARIRLLAVPRLDLHRRRIGAGRAGGRPLRRLPRLPRHLPHPSLSRPLQARRAALHLLSDDRA